MTKCFFATDLHGRADRYRKLLSAIRAEKPRAVFFGGDLLPHFGLGPGAQDFVRSQLLVALDGLRAEMAEAYPRIFLILGNDDPRVSEEALLGGASRGLFSYLHMKKENLLSWTVYGYAMTPPSPFRLKDWERYDVGRCVGRGSVSPEDGMRSVAVEPEEICCGTIAADLDMLAGSDDLAHAVFLMHAPPYGTVLDRAALDGKSADHVPLDVHVGSIAVRRFIEARQPLVTLHGHVHESARITGAWQERIGRTLAMSAAHEGPELALVSFDLEDPGRASRRLI
jgi:Icc-related predicted phosphoesterase